MPIYLIIRINFNAVLKSYTIYNVFLPTYNSLILNVDAWYEKNVRMTRVFRFENGFFCLLMDIRKCNGIKCLICLHWSTFDGSGAGGGGGGNR